MRISFEPGRVVLCGGAAELSLADTLDCGQAFRWARGADGVWRGMARARYLELFEQDGDLVLCCGRPEFEAFWYDYFDLGRDYSAIRALLSRDPVLARAVRYAPGIRVLRQDPWEATLTFILSANNNVARIKGLVERLCAGFGEATPHGAAFPTPEALAPLCEADLAPLRAGYRDRYLLDCARRAACGELDFAALRALPLEQARQALCRVRGIGPKVADCALLFGCGRCDCFPRDVWINRAMERLFPAGLPEFALPYAGIAQQYLFHYVRTGDGLAACAAPARQL